MNTLRDLLHHRLVQIAARYLGWWFLYKTKQSLATDANADAAGDFLISVLLIAFDHYSHRQAKKRATKPAK